MRVSLARVMMYYVVMMSGLHDGTLAPRFAVRLGMQRYDIHEFQPRDRHDVNRDWPHGASTIARPDFLNLTIFEQSPLNSLLSTVNAVLHEGDFAKQLNLFI